MKTKSYISKKNGEREYNILLENVKVVWCHIARPDTKGIYADNKYKVTALLSKNDKQTKEFIDLFKLISLENNNKEITGQKYPIKDRSNEKSKIENLIKNETDENKKKFLKDVCLPDVIDNFFIQFSSKFEIPIIDSKGKEVEDLETVIFNHKFVNLQFKLCQPKGKDYFSRYLQGIQLKEIERFEKGLMFDTDENEETDDDLPF